METTSQESEFGLKRVIGAVSRDKNIESDVIVDALEQAMVHAARRVFGASADLEAHYNAESDEIDFFSFAPL